MNKDKAKVCTPNAKPLNVTTTTEKPKEKKSVEDLVVSLRQELHVLYESLKDKNEQLTSLEKDVRDRDISIRYLKSEYKKLKDSTNVTNGNSRKSPANDGQDTLNGDKNNGDHQPDDIIQKMQKDLKDREYLIKELNKKIIRLSDNLIFVQKESLSKDDRMEEMQHEVDKFRQVVREINNFLTITLLTNWVIPLQIGSSFHKSYYGAT